MKRDFEELDDIHQKVQTIPEELPILPVRDAVIFPHAVTPLTVGRESSVKLINDVQQNDGMLVVLTQRDKRVDSPGPADLYEIGTVSMVHRVMKTPEGNLFVIIMGVSRTHIDEFVQFEPYLRANISVLGDEKEDESGVDFQALRRTVVSQFERIIKLSPQLPDDLQTIVINIEDAGRLADYIATNLPNLSIVSKQFVLEQIQVRKRLEFLNTELAKELEVLELRSKIQNQVQEEVGKSQREYFLREQLRAIQRELGEADDTQREIEELRQKIEAAGMTEEAKKEAERELGRLGRMSPAAAEYTVTRTYLDWLVTLPWSVLTTEKIDIIKVREVLDRDHYDLEKIKERILEYLAVLELRPQGKAPILCFVGPPGVGKTSLGRSIAGAMGRKFVRISLGGMRDEAEIRGHRRTYIGSVPGRIIQELRRAGTRNPVFMLDEIDKIGADFRGDPASALLEVLDPRQNGKFVDRYLDVPFDLSQVIFIGTANYIDGVPEPLRDRIEVISLPGYTEREKLEIAKRYLVRRQMEENGLKPEQCEWQDDALRQIINDYTHEAGVRELERQIGAICRGIASRVARGKTEHVTVTPQLVAQMLGPAQYVRETKLKKSKTGVVTGLAYTPAGGEVLHIEATRYPGKGNVTLTGHIGEVMKESVQAALSLVRSRDGEIGVKAEDFRDMDIHVHVPAGAVPKDGPSAGIAMFTALASLFTNTPVRPDVAMTGEITLRGLVLPIGGLKEKSLAAMRAGISTVIIPKLNEKDLFDVPEEAKQKLKFVPVENVDEVLAVALEKDGATSASERKSA